MAFPTKEKCEHRNTKPDVVVPVVRIVPVAIGAAHVPVFIVERAAAQHTVRVSLPREAKRKQQKENSKERGRRA